MNTQDLAFNRLLKKLSALRATLKGDERNLLDTLITGPVDEVGAHSMKVTTISPARSTARATSPDEARANAMKVSTARSTARATSPDEVRANAMTIHIVFDPSKDEYQRIQ